MDVGPSYLASLTGQLFQFSKIQEIAVDHSSHEIMGQENLQLAQPHTSRTEQAKKKGPRPCWMAMTATHVQIPEV